MSKDIELWPLIGLLFWGPRLTTTPYKPHSGVIHSDTTHRLSYDQPPTQEAPMTPSEYQVEKTAIGMQYVIPGTERIVKPKRRV